MGTVGVAVEMDLDECKDLLNAVSFGRVSFVLDGQPVIFPVNYRFEDDTIVFQTHEGSALASADLSRMAFEIDGLDPEHHGGWSVLAVGTAYRITSALDHRSEHLQQIDIPSVASPSEVRVELVPRQISGRRLGVPQDQAV